jgi:hypothetical protein
MKNNIMIYFRFCFLFLILGSLQSQDLYWANANAKPKADEYINSIMLDNSTAFYWCTDRVVITLDHGVNWLEHKLADGRIDTPFVSAGHLYCQSGNVQKMIGLRSGKTETETTNKENLLLFHSDSLASSEYIIEHKISDLKDLELVSIKMNGISIQRILSIDRSNIDGKFFASVELESDTKEALNGEYTIISDDSKGNWSFIQSIRKIKFPEALVGEGAYSVDHLYSKGNYLFLSSDRYGRLYKVDTTAHPYAIPNIISFPDRVIGPILIDNDFGVQCIWCSSELKLVEKSKSQSWIDVKTEAELKEIIGKIHDSTSIKDREMEALVLMLSK